MDTITNDEELYHKAERMFGIKLGMLSKQEKERVMSLMRDIQSVEREINMATHHKLAAEKDLHKIFDKYKDTLPNRIAELEKRCSNAELALDWFATQFVSLCHSGTVLPFCTPDLCPTNAHACGHVSASMWLHNARQRMKEEKNAS